jgi:MFS family permease
MMITMVLSSVIGGQVISRTGHYKLPGLFGMTIMTIGLFLLSGMGPDTSYLTVVRNMIILGIGMGPTMPVFTLAAQNAVDIAQLGVVTSLTQFARSIGSTLGVAIFGSLLTNAFAPSFQAALPPSVVSTVPAGLLSQFENPQVLLNPQIAGALQTQIVALGPSGAQTFNDLYGAIRIGLVGALHDVFLLGAVLGALGVVAVLFLKELPLRKSFAPAMDEPTEAIAQIGHEGLPSLPPLRPEDEPIAARQTESRVA